MSTIVTRSEFARIAGIHKGTVTKLAKAGRLVLTDDGRVRLEESLKRWQATKGHRTDVEARNAANRGRPTAAVQERAENAAMGEFEAESPRNDAANDPDTDPKGRLYWRMQRIRYENAGLRLAMDLRAGRRHPLPAAQREFHAIGTDLRAGLERINDITAPRLSVLPEADRARLIHEELRTLRRQVRQAFPRALVRVCRRVRGDGA